MEPMAFALLMLFFICMLVFSSFFWLCFFYNDYNDAVDGMEEKRWSWVSKKYSCVFKLTNESDPDRVAKNVQGWGAHLHSDQSAFRLMLDSAEVLLEMSGQGFLLTHHWQKRDVVQRAREKKKRASRTERKNRGDFWRLWGSRPLERIAGPAKIIHISLHRVVHFSW